MERKLNIDELKKIGITCPKNGLLIIQVSSRWCNSCRKLELVLKKLEKQDSFKFIIIDIDTYPQLSQILKVSTVPLLIFFRNGELIEKNIEINNFRFLKNGIMDSITSEYIIREILVQI